MLRSTRDRIAGLLALAVMVALVAGVPILLIRLAGWPLPDSMPDWARVRRSITQGDIPAEVVVNVLAVAVWLIWLQLVWALLWELAVNLPRVASGRRPRSAPLVPAAVGNGVGRLVAMIIAIGTVVTSTPAPAVALPSAPLRTVMTPSTGRVEQPAPVHRVATATAVDSPRWKVDRADSLWRIAEAALGDGERAGEILERNQWLVSPRNLKAGHILILPDDATVPDDRQPAAPTADPPPPRDAPATDNYIPATDVGVEAGDTLWELAEERLATVDDLVTPAETLAYVNDIITANPDAVEDPNLIYPGEVFTFPAVGTPPSAPPPAVTATPIEPTAQPVGTDAEPSDTPAVPDPHPAPAATAPEPVSDTVPLPGAATADTAPRTTAPQPDDASTAPRGAQTEVGSLPDHGGRSLSAPWLAGITGATALASGLLLLYRRRLTVRAAHVAAAYRAAAPDDPTVLTAVTRASNVSLLRWANTALADLMARLEPSDVDGQPLAIELSEISGIELLWTRPNRRAPQPWHAMSGGWAWQLPYGPDEPVGNTERPAAIPALVTIGRRDGNDLLLNLEAVGTLAVDGDDQPAADFVRALVAELAVGEILSDAYVVTTGLDVDGLAGIERVQRRDRQGAGDALGAAIEASRAFLHEYALDTAFAARLGGDATGRETTIVAVDDEYAAPLHHDVTPGLAACLIYTGLRTDGPCVRITGDGTAVLEPHGIAFEPAALPLPTLEAVSDLLDEAAEPYIPPSAESTAEEKPPSGSDVLVDDLGDGEDDWTFPDPAVLVRVLGAPEVIGVTLGRIETSIVAYLACHGGKRRDEQVINAVWNGRAVETKTLWNRISKIRAVLGPEIVPARLPNSSNVVLSDGVMTDLGVLARVHARAQHISEAEALQLLLRGLDLIDGVPFDSPEYDWSFETQDHATACETVEAATLHCIDIAMNLGDLNAARHAVTQGLRALPLNEPLYRARMRIEIASGNPEGARRALSELTSALGDASRTAEAAPEAETLRLVRELTPTAS
jgi:DNA-binding SARP family transcriptional activator